MVDLDDLKAHLGTDQVEADPDSDAVLSDLEERAASFVESETDRHFGATESFTEYFDGHGGKALFLNERPDEVTSVHERDEVGDDWDEILAGDDDGFEVRGFKLLRKNSHKWQKNVEYRVIYDFGYAAGEEPKEIRQLVIDLVAFRWRQRGIEGHASGRLGDYGFTALELDAIPGARQALERWRWPRVG